MIGDWLTLSWKTLLGRGVLAIVFGVIAMARPETTLLALVLVWGAWALLDGFTMIGGAFVEGSVGQRLGAVLLGVIAVVAGVLAFARPGLAVVTITWVLGIWLIARGVSEVVAAFVQSLGSSRWLVLAAALLDLVLGIILFLNPGRAALSLTYVVGLVALAWGLVFVATAFAVRKEQRAVSQPAG